ncbi:LOW QUALITY PROTEIN: hypothetical protein RJ639_021611, partial [Escallonia herrerae]
WYARLPGLQEPANYGTKFKTGVYEEQVKSGYRLPLHPFALRFFEHYRMAPRQLVPNGWRKLAGLIYLVQTSGYKPDATDFMRVFFEICFVKRVANCPRWYYIHNRQRLLKGGPKSNKGWHSRYFFVSRLDKGSFRLIEIGILSDFEYLGKPTPNNQTKHILSHIKLGGGLCINEPLSEEQLEWAKIIPSRPIPTGLLILSPPRAIPSVTSVETVHLGEVQGETAKCGVAPVPKKTRVTPPEHSPRILEQVSIDDDPIFRPRWTLRRDDLGMPDSQVSEQHLLHGILPRDKEVFQTQTHETFACSFAQAVYTREAVKEAQEASHRAEELSKQEADHLAQIMTLEKWLERVKRKASEEVTKARDQGIRDFLDGNAGDEWLKKRTDDGLEIYELGFAKAKEMFAQRFPDIPLGDFVLPAIVSPSGETVMPLEARDATASHLPGKDWGFDKVWALIPLKKKCLASRQDATGNIFTNSQHSKYKELVLQKVFPVYRRPVFFCLNIFVSLLEKGFHITWRTFVHRECELGCGSKASEECSILHRLVQVIDFQSGCVESSEKACQRLIFLLHNVQQTRRVLPLGVTAYKVLLKEI